jgi:polysaccharide biosynthesis protein PslG
VRAGRRVLCSVALGMLVGVAALGCSSDEPLAQAPADPRPIVWGFAENLQGDVSTIPEKLTAMNGIGARMVRFDIGLEPAEAEAVEKARAAGLGVLGVITGGSRDPEIYAARAERIVRRYAPLGVHHYEIWNEPNVVQTWPTADDPDRATTEYMAMVRAAYPRIKAADPRSVVLVGALSRREYVGGRPNDWVAAMYEKGLKDNSDAISLHPYTDPDLPGDDSKAASAWLQMTGPWDDRTPSVRESMVSNGDGAKTVWITEFSAPTGGDLGFPVSEQRQAQILRRAVTLAQTYPWLGGFLWYGLRDSVSGAEQFGVLRADGSRKPSYEQFASAIRRTRGRPAGE